MTVDTLLNQEEIVKEHFGKKIRVISVENNLCLGGWWLNETKKVQYYRATEKYFLIYV